MVHQIMLDECEDYFVSAADLEQAQELLKSSIRPPAEEDWERKQKYFGSLPAKLICNTFKYTTQCGVLSPSSHLQKRFKSPNLVLNLHRQNEANAADQTSSDTPTMDGGETSARIFVGQDSEMTHIFVGHDSKITDTYKAKDNSGKKFLGAFQDRVCTKGLHIKLVADNTQI